MEKQFNFKEDVGGYFGTAILAYLLISVTFGFGTPWAIVMIEKWKAQNTTIDGRQVEFVGSGSDLLGKFIVWSLLTMITFGIYGLWMQVKMQKWKVENLQFVN